MSSHLKRLGRIPQDTAFAIKTHLVLPLVVGCATGHKLSTAIRTRLAADLAREKEEICTLKLAVSDAKNSQPQHK